MRIAIIGCGVVGAAIAYELSCIAGLKITVIEKNQPASAATGAALGVLMGTISQKKKGRAWKLRSTSLKRYETLIPELEAKTGQNIPVNRQGILKLLFTGDRLDRWEKLQEFRQTEGWDLEIWDNAEISRRCPQINQQDIIGAVYSPQDRQIHPAKLTEALVAAAKINGVDFHFGTECNYLKTNNPDRLTTSKGDIELDRLIVSAGLGSTPLIATINEKIKIRPVLGQALKIKLEEDLGQADFQPVITGDDVHLVPLGNREYWLGATVEFPDDAGEVVAQSELLTKVKERAISFCPAIANATILESWVGKRPRPEGISAPIIERLSGSDNIFLATAHYRNGVLLAPATALKIKELILDS